MRLLSRHTARSLLAITAAAALLGGCHSLGPGARKGAAIGSVLGAGAGWAIGANNGHAAAGAIGGALVGGLVGGMIGDHHDYSQGYSRPVVVHRYAAPRRVVYRTVRAPRVVYHHAGPYHGHGGHHGHHSCGCGHN